MQAKFRPATLEDVPEIIQLTNECFNEKTDVAHAEKIFQKNDANAIYFVGILEEKIVAFSRITIIETPFDGMEAYAILNHVCVKPEYRRHHLGTQLLTATEKLCKERGCISLKLWSKNFRIPAHAMYQKFGFKIIDAKFFEKSLEGGDDEN